eukprot:Opistho-2@34661
MGLHTGIRMLTTLTMQLHTWHTPTPTNVQRKRKLAYDFTAKRPAKRAKVGRPPKGSTKQTETIVGETEEDRRKREAAAAERRARRAAEAEASGVRKSQRSSAIERDVEYRRKAEERAEKKKGKYKRSESFTQKLTQEELLKEAEETAVVNVGDLDRYLRMEDERRKNRNERPRYVGPAVRFLSTSKWTHTTHTTHTEGGESAGSANHSATSALPSEGVAPAPGEGPSASDARDASAVASAPLERVCRNFITFPSEELLPSLFTSTRPIEHKPSLCTITGLPAKYKDPLSGRPYATADAFKMIRSEG